MAGHIITYIVAVAAAIAVILFPTTVWADLTRYPHQRCATNAAEQRALDLKSRSVLVGPRPWGLTYLNDTIAFATVNFAVAVLNTTEFAPRVIAYVPLPRKNMGNDDPQDDGYGYRELALSHDKQTLYIATGYGAAIVDVNKAFEEPLHACIGVLSRKGITGRSAIELSITPDDKHVFISQEFGSTVTGGRGAIEVYQVDRLDDGTVNSTFKGFIALGYATVSQQFSPDYSKLYVTSEMYETGNSTGLLAVLDVATLTETPDAALLNKVRSGCRPVRCWISEDGTQLWVSERDANQISVYDAALLAINTSRTADVIEGTMSVGTSPIGIIGVGHYVLTADSNRFNYTNATTGITVINSRAVLEQRELVANPQIATFAFPRGLAVSPDGNTLLVSEFGAGTVRAINTTLLNIGTDIEDLFDEAEAEGQ